MDEMLAMQLAQIGEANGIIGFIVFTATSTVMLPEDDNDEYRHGIVEADMDVVTPVEIHSFLHGAANAIATRLEDEDLSDSRMQLPVDSHLLEDNNE